MTKPRYLTKSRFKLAVECPTKLFYTGKEEYVNKKIDDSFLLALAEGGFQVGELAKLYFPGGQDITTLDYDEALNQTNQLLSQEQAIIYEAAIKFENLFIRADILVKTGNFLELIEVKAKSFDSTTEDPFYTKKGTIRSGWKEYLFDVSFQKHVLTKAFPDHRNNAYLMMVDKNAICPTDGLNQKFRIIKDQEGRKSVSVSPYLTEEDLQTRLMVQVNVDNVCNDIFGQSFPAESSEVSFSQWIDYLSEQYRTDYKIFPPISKECSSCEFNADKMEREYGKKCGFRECWQEAYNWQEEDFDKGSVLDIWRFLKKDQMIEQGCIHIEDIDEDVISPVEDGKPGLSTKQRQWLQVQKCRDNDNFLWIDRENLHEEIGKWRYPLHLIDFETSMVAIPFNRGRRPYEGIAFQFSHHTIQEDGKVEHSDEYLHVAPGIFPNYEFLRNLMAALSGDQGSIFRYADHENSYLNLIYRQLLEDPRDIPDRNELMAFIRSVTRSTKDSVDEWQGNRCMIDLLELVKRYYYDPDTKGKNSIKQILPSILNRSTKLKDKYSRPIYGAQDGIKSMNFKDWTWVQLDGEKVIDPYTLLPKMFQDIDENGQKLLFSDVDELREGGAAMTAYARLQFEELTDYEREEIEAALLKYCELDTMAMVMIVEGWQDLIS